MQEEGNENGKAWMRRILSKDGSMSLAGDSALPNEFRFGNTSDNAPFVLLSWIWITWIRDLRAESAAPKALIFSDFLTYRPTPWFLQHNKAQHY